MRITQLLWVRMALYTLLMLLGIGSVGAQFVPVGSGSYRTTFPGNDVAGRNGYPAGTPQLSGKAVGRPVPTNDWWSLLLKENHAANLFTYPFTLKTVNKGLVVSYIPFGAIDDMLPITVGLEGLNASRATVADYSDWTATFNWTDGVRSMNVTAGIALPFLYFTKQGTETVQITVTSGQVSIRGEVLLLANAKNGSSFAIYAPSGSTWTQNGQIYSSTLNGRNYWSMCMLPFAQTDLTAVAEQYRTYAYTFPTDTRATWHYDEATSVMRTDFEVTTTLMEGNGKHFLMGLLPHQWSRLRSDTPALQAYTYPSVRGQIRTLATHRFSVENSFHGILPTLPYLGNHSEGFNPSALTDKVEAVKFDALATWTDSYNEGQVMNRLIQVARIAHETGNIEARDQMLNTVQTRLENWLTASAGEVAFLFYYNQTWSALLGYPAGHGQDTNLNDHHFHWGYFIHAASFLEQYRPGWATRWGEMVNTLVRDAASFDRNDALFPYLRNFSPYAGHCWANGFATFPQGNDQESTSESMQFNSSLIHWGTITGNKAVRDLGIYLYTTEQSAIEEYWFDTERRNFQSSQPYALVSRVWGNSYDNGTFWTGDIAASYGIEMYPIHGGSLYLGHKTAYADRLWKEIAKNTGILTNQVNPNLWHDVMWEYLAFTNPAEAIRLYNSNPGRELKFGVADAQTYYWLHAMNALGEVDATITADYPIAAAFRKGDEITYTAHNYDAEPRTITFSTGYKLNVAARSMANSQSVAVSGSLTTLFDRAYANGSIPLQVDITSGSANKVSFYDGEQLLGECTQAPYRLTASQLSPAVHRFYARIYDGEKYDISNICTVTVGRQLPFGSSPHTLPGSFEAGQYDSFEGGLGQGISYRDATMSNSGDIRKDEYVDVSMHATEGSIVGSIAQGEWLEYTVDVAASGIYTLSMRYSSGNAKGGGPFHIEMDGNSISKAITVPSTSANSWNVWATCTVPGLELTEGLHILRLAFQEGELNIGRLAFERTGNLTHAQPIACAGANKKVILPQKTVTLDGSGSSTATGTLTYQWQQQYGPSVLTFSDATLVSPVLTDLEEGIYLLRLTVTNESGYADSDEQYLIVTATPNVLPTVSITAPANGAEYIEGTAVDLIARADDIDGSIASVSFYVDGRLLGTADALPYIYRWNAEPGIYQLTAVATDNEGGVTTSKPIRLVYTPAPSCEGESSNGDFRYRFSEENDNPTLTFVPAQSNIGSTLCLLYYGTSPSGPLPGMAVRPNVPYRLNARKGETIYFYYTYSTPTGERNTADSKQSYLIGSCRGGIGLEDVSVSSIGYAPNPVIDKLYLQLPTEDCTLTVYTLSGQNVETLHSPASRSSSFEMDMSCYSTGFYLIKVSYSDVTEYLKVMKQ